MVVGGYFYEGEALTQLAGSYVFADWSSGFGRGDGTLYMARPAAEGLWKIERIRVADRIGGRINEYVRSFGEDDRASFTFSHRKWKDPQEIQERSTRSIKD